MHTGVWGYGKPSGGIKAQWMWHAGLEVMHRIVISPQFLLGWSQSSSRTLSEVWHQHKNNNNLLHAWINVTLRGRNWHRVNKKTTKKQRKQRTGKKEDEKKTVRDRCAWISPVPEEKPGRLKLYCFTSSYQRSATSLPAHANNWLELKGKSN